MAAPGPVRLPETKRTWQALLSNEPIINGFAPSQRRTVVCGQGGTHVSETATDEEKASLDGRDRAPGRIDCGFVPERRKAAGRRHAGRNRRRQHRTPDCVANREQGGDRRTRCESPGN